MKKTQFIERSRFCLRVLAAAFLLCANLPAWAQINSTTTGSQAVSPVLTQQYPTNIAVFVDAQTGLRLNGTAGGVSLTADAVMLTDTSVADFFSRNNITNEVDRTAVFDTVAMLKKFGLFSHLVDWVSLRPNFGAGSNSVVSFFGLTNTTASSFTNGPSSFNGGSTLSFNRSSGWPVTNTMAAIVAAYDFGGGNNPSTLPKVMGLFNGTNSGEMMMLSGYMSPVTKTGRVETAATSFICVDGATDLYNPDSNRKLLTISYTTFGTNCNSSYDGWPGHPLAGFDNPPNYKITDASFLTLQIGAEAGNSNYFTGKIFDVFIYDAVLTTNQLALNYTATLPLEEKTEFILHVGDSLNLNPVYTNNGGAAGNFFLNGGFPPQLMASPAYTNSMWLNVSHSGTETIDYAPGGNWRSVLTNAQRMVANSGAFTSKRQIGGWGANDLENAVAQASIDNAISNIAIDASSSGFAFTWLGQYVAGTNSANPSAFYWTPGAENNINKWPRSHAGYFAGGIAPRDQWSTLAETDTNLPYMRDALHPRPALIARWVNNFTAWDKKAPNDFYAVDSAGNIVASLSSTRTVTNYLPAATWVSSGGFNSRLAPSAASASPSFIPDGIVYAATDSGFFIDFMCPDWATNIVLNYRYSCDKTNDMFRQVVSTCWNTNGVLVQTTASDRTNFISGINQTLTITNNYPNAKMPKWIQLNSYTGTNTGSLRYFLGPAELICR